MYKMKAKILKYRKKKGTFIFTFVLVVSVCHVLETPGLTVRKLDEGWNFI